MRIVFLLSLLGAVVVTGIFWHQTEPYYCQYPLTYKLGDIDERFQISEEEALQSIEEAEKLWEEATDTDLLEYDPNGVLTINFVYDERQDRSDKEKEMRSELEDLQNQNEAMNENYVRLVVTHKNLQDEYEDRSDEYEEKLAAYNKKVQKYNQSGGAPPEVYKELESLRNELESEADILTEQVQEINDLTQQINTLGERGNELVKEYNQFVAQYNEKFGQSHEFTQGDYQDKTIKIYTFTNDRELEQVLAHELGHALGIGHVDNDKAVMYHMMGPQIEELTLADEDISALREVCTTTKWWDIL